MDFVSDSSSVFNFQALDLPLSWGKLRNCDVSRITANSDVESLLRYSSEICLGSIDDRGQDPSMIKAVKLAQLSAQYLAHCNGTLHTREKIIRKALRTFKSEEDALDYEIFKLRAKEEHLRTEYSEYSKLHRDYVDLLDSMEPKVADVYRKNRGRRHEQQQKLPSRRHGADAAKYDYDDDGNDYKSDVDEDGFEGDNSQIVESNELAEKLSRIDRKSGKNSSKTRFAAPPIANPNKSPPQITSNHHTSSLHQHQEETSYFHQHKSNHNNNLNNNLNQNEPESKSASHSSKVDERKPMSPSSSSSYSNAAAVKTSLVGFNDTTSASASTTSQAPALNSTEEWVTKSKVDTNDITSAQVASSWNSAKPTATASAFYATTMSVDSLNIVDSKAHNGSIFNTHVHNKGGSSSNSSRDFSAITKSDLTHKSDNNLLQKDDFVEDGNKLHQKFGHNFSTRTSLSSIPSDMSDSRNSIEEFETIANNNQSSNLRFLEGTGTDRSSAAPTHSTESFDNDDEDYDDSSSNNYSNSNVSSNHNSNRISNHQSTGSNFSYNDEEDDPFDSVRTNNAHNTSEIDTSMSVSIDYGYVASTSNNNNNSNSNNDNSNNKNSAAPPPSVFHKFSSKINLSSSLNSSFEQNDAGVDNAGNRTGESRVSNNSNNSNNSTNKTTNNSSNSNGNKSESQLGKTQLVSYLQRPKDNDTSNFGGTSLTNFDLQISTSPVVDDEENDDVLLGTIGHTGSISITNSSSVSDKVVSYSATTAPLSAPAISSRNKQFFPDDSLGTSSTIDVAKAKASTITLTRSNVASSSNIDDEVNVYSSFDSDSSPDVSTNADSKRHQETANAANTTKNKNKLSLNDSDDFSNLNNNLELQDVSDFLDISSEKIGLSVSDTRTNVKTTSSTASNNSNNISNNSAAAALTTTTKAPVPKKRTDDGPPEWRLGRASLELTATAKALDVVVTSVNFEDYVKYEYTEFQVSLVFAGIKSPLSFSCAINQKSIFQNINFASHILCNDKVGELVSAEIEREHHNLSVIVNVHVTDSRSKQSKILGSAEVNVWVMVEDSVDLLRKEINVESIEDGDSIGSIMLDVRGYSALAENNKNY